MSASALAIVINVIADMDVRFFDGDPIDEADAIDVEMNDDVVQFPGWVMATPASQGSVWLCGSLRLDDLLDLVPFTLPASFYDVPVVDPKVSA